jgi:hypothetical protein
MMRSEESGLFTSFVGALDDVLAIVDDELATAESPVSSGLAMRSPPKAWDRLRSPFIFAIRVPRTSCSEES